MLATTPHCAALPPAGTQRQCNCCWGCLLSVAWTLVPVAAGQGHTAVVRLLLELPPHRGVDAAAIDNYALRTAAARGHVEVVQLLLELPAERGVDAGARDNDALRCAASGGHVDVLRLLVALPAERGE